MPNNLFTAPCLRLQAEYQDGLEQEDFVEPCCFEVQLTDSKILEIPGQNGDETSYKSGNMAFKFDIRLQCAELEELLKEKKVAFFMRIVQNRCKYRLVKRLTPVTETHTTERGVENSYEAEFPVGGIETFRVEIFLAGIANTTWIHTDVDGELLELALEPGRVCAYARLQDKLEIPRSEIQVKLASIFMLKPCGPDNEFVNQGDFSCDATESDRLTIYVHRKDYQKVASFEKSYPQKFKANVVLPSLTSVLFQVYQSEQSGSSDSYEGTNWYNAIEKALFEKGLEIKNRKPEDALGDAQLLLDHPLLLTINENHE